MSDQKKPKCPICRKEVELLSENEYFPFCSKRCKMEDLGKWLDEDYSITMTPATTERSLPDDDSSSN
ncbi:MAG: DNA gyrase inhibitor YacG [Myxococcota bacterium]